ncbi:hypothetical protein AHF37_11955 [Paragonimus kellicotti]|nr:hypothetical protein AHF37_11955 [Paragonimus kellicotti]
MGIRRKHTTSKEQQSRDRPIGMSAKQSN